MSDVLVSCENVGKKFCRDLKRSLWYGVKDSMNDLIRREGPKTNVDLGGASGSITAGSFLRQDEFWANSDVSFELKRGECLGLIGRNGAGKTTLLKLLCGLIKPDYGTIEIRGRVGALIALGAGFNPILTGRENVFVAGSVLGLSRSEIKSRLDEIIAFSDLEDFMDTPVRNYSSGMQVRLGFAVASAIEPDVLIIDEVLAVGDVGFRSKCYNRIYEVCKSAAVIFVSHNMPQVDRLCSRAMVLNGGETLFQGSTGDAINEYNLLFPSNTNEWQIADGTEIYSIFVNGDDKSKNFQLIGSDPLCIELVAKFSERAKELEIAVTFLEKSFDLISQANSRFSDDNVVNQCHRQILRIHIPSPNLGSGTKLMSITVRDAKDNEILFWAHGAWELAITNPHFIPSPSSVEATFS